MDDRDGLREHHKCYEWHGRDDKSMDDLYRYGADSFPNGTATIWSARAWECTHTLSAHDELVCSAALPADADKVLTASLNGTATIWSARLGECTQTLSEQSELVRAAAFVSRCAYGTDSFPKRPGIFGVPVLGSARRHYLCMLSLYVLLRFRPIQIRCRQLP